MTLPEHPATRSKLARARYRRIMRFATAAMVQLWWFELTLPRLGLRRLAERGRVRRLQRLARRFHALALDLGGLMIKVGQFLSSRLDVLPPEITSELEGLQDEVPAVPFGLIRASAESELGLPLERAYAFVDLTPIAAASFGQAHRARLTPGLAEDAGVEDVVVKVQRPGIAEIVDVDLAALRTVGQRLSRVKVISTRADAPALVEEFAATSLEEIDYLHEAANAERFAELFADDPRIGAPEVIWERTTRRVLTLTDVTAIKITDVDALIAAGIDPKEVADQVAQATFEQLFVHGFFHADPHPGNIFVTPTTTPDGSADWRLTYIDFGMMGTITEELRSGLRSLVIAAVARDGKGLVRAVQKVGVLLPSADTVELERAMSELFDRFGGMSISEVQQVDPRQFEDFGERFRDTIQAMPFQLPESFLLLMRTISLVSGVTSALDPQFNMWAAVDPFAKRLLREESQGAVRGFAHKAMATASSLAALPGRMDELTTRIERGQIAVQTPGVERRLRRLDRTIRRAISAVLFAVLLIAGAVVRADDTVFGTVLMAFSGLPLLHVLAGYLPRR